MGAAQSLGKNYAKVQSIVIRPPRQIYKDDDLGPVVFTFGGVEFCRVDFVVQNARGMTLRCSHWMQAAEGPTGCLAPGQRRGGSAGVPPPCVVYLHGNAGCRLEARDVLPCALAMGCSMVAFDFSGSGISEGEHVSLGWYEQHDLATVVSHLRRSNRVGGLFLWGRSMGAVTALLYASSESGAAGEVDGMVLDSPFSDFAVVAAERAEHAQSKGLLIPGGALLVPMVLAVLSLSIQAEAGFDPRDLDPTSAARKCKVPALFLIGEDDQFIPPSHGRRLFAAYGGQKRLLAFPGGHNSQRPVGVYEFAAGFLAPAMRAPGVERPRPRGVAIHNDLRPPWEASPAERSTWLGTLCGSSSFC